MLQAWSRDALRESLCVLQAAELRIVATQALLSLSNSTTSPGYLTWNCGIW